MKQPEMGNRRDLIAHRFQIAKEDLETTEFLCAMGRKIVKEEIRHASD